VITTIIEDDCGQDEELINGKCSPKSNINAQLGLDECTYNNKEWVKRGNSCRMRCEEEGSAWSVRSQSCRELKKSECERIFRRVYRNGECTRECRNGRKEIFEEKSKFCVHKKSLEECTNNGMRFDSAKNGCMRCFRTKNEKHPNNCCLLKLTHKYHEEQKGCHLNTSVKDALKNVADELKKNDCKLKPFPSRLNRVQCVRAERIYDNRSRTCTKKCSDLKRDVFYKSLNRCYLRKSL